MASSPATRSWFEAGRPAVAALAGRHGGEEKEGARCGALADVERGI